GGGCDGGHGAVARAAAEPLRLDVGDGGRQPVLELVVEAVLGLAGLQVEETEDERTRQAEQRGRERDAHAAEWGSETVLEILKDSARTAADRQPINYPPN